MITQEERRGVERERRGKVFRSKNPKATKIIFSFFISQLQNRSFYFDPTQVSSLSPDRFLDC